MHDETPATTDLDPRTLADTKGAGLAAMMGAGQIILAIAYAIGYSLYIAATFDPTYLGLGA
ncbi:MAG: hypothetical protein NVS1B4_21570 [Gemmatimonadaceae bacterium]